MGKQPPCQNGGVKIYHSDVKCSYLPRGTYTDYEGWLYILQSSHANLMSNWKNTEHEVMHFQTKGGLYMQT